MTDHRPSPRRRFLATLAGSSAALAAGSLTPRDLLAEDLHTAFPQGGWDLSWVDKVERAHHRIVFDSPDVADGLALNNASVYLSGYKEVYNTSDSDLGVVVVVRHQGMALVLNDSIWARLKFGESTNKKDASGEFTKRNPWVKLRPEDQNSAAAGDPGVDTLLQRGVIVLACNLALGRVAGRLATAENLSRDEARKQINDNLIPGVVRQVSGIFAVARAQEAGAHYIRSVP